MIFLPLREMELPENHALNALHPITAPDEKSVTEWLAGKSIEEIRELMGK